MNFNPSEEVNFQQISLLKNSVNECQVNDTCTETLAEDILSPIQEELGGVKTVDSVVYGKL